MGPAMTMTRTSRRSTGPSIAPWIFVAACGGEVGPLPPPAGDAYVQEIERWREKRHQNLLADDGWLNLVGLEWLEEGENSFGAGSENRVRFPEGKAPEAMGWFVVAGDRVSVRVLPGVDVRHQGQPVTSLDLRTDAEGDPTLLEYGTLRFFVIRRGDRFAVRIRDLESPTQQSFSGLESFPVDPKWRVEARFEPYDPPKPIPVPNILGTVEEESSPGAVVWAMEGKIHRLDALSADDDRLFLIFADETTGRETYGGGRYLYADPPSPDGRIVLDFNRAYNPPCVFTPYATCPLPPPQNRLALRVEAGEKVYRKKGEVH